MDQPAGSAVPPSDRGAGLRRPGTSHRRAVRIGLAASAVLHVFVLLVYPSVARIRPAIGPASPVPVAGRSGGGVVVIDLVPVDALTDPERPPTPAELRELEAPAVSPGRPQVGDPVGPGLVAPGPTAAERLRPSLQDRRLWAPLDPELNQLTTEQIQELELSGRIAEWQDSVAAALAADRALTDWTKTDAQGRRWGISEGKLHLGDVTLPLPFAFGTPVGRRDEVNRRTWEWEEIQRGAVTGEMRDSWKARAQAIRERRDRERAALPRPDTSGARR